MNVPKLRFKEFNESYNIKEINEITYNVASGKISKPVEDGNYNIYGSMGKIGTSNFYDYEGEKVLVARVGANAGSVNKINEKCCISDNTLVLEPKDVLNDYLYYSLKHYKPQKLIFGSGQPLVTGGQLKKIKLGIPGEKEQLKVANFLSLLDKKIELQTKKIEDLKLFKKGLLYTIFNNKKANTNIENCIDYGKSGGTPLSSNKDYYDGTIPFLSITDITNQGKYIFSTEKMISQKGLDNSSAWLIPKDSLILSMYASYGLVAINKIELSTSQAMFNMIINKNNNVEYIYYYLEYLYENNYYDKLVSTGTQSNLNADKVKKIKIYLPNLEEQNTISIIFKCVDNKLNCEFEKLKNMNKLKKGLMQNMFV